MINPTLANNPTRHYQQILWDSARWNGFETRPDDILICTPYKSGTTWMQTICALLIFQTADFGKPLAEITPWMDIKTEPAPQVHALYEAQKHRRFIKTHTPLDGLPWFAQATYLIVMRDPRDVFISLLNHLQNMNPNSNTMFAPALRQAHEEHPLPEDPNEFFQMWLSNGSFEWETDGAPFWSLFRHGAGFWQHKDEANIHMLHYSDLKADLEGGMRKIARILSLDIPENKWPELIDAARFETMKKNADKYAPESHFDLWKDNSKFFNKGSSGQWQGVLSKESLALLDEVTAKYPRDYIDWLVRG